MLPMKPPRSLGLVHTPRALQNHLELVAKTLSNISFGNTASNSDADMNMHVWKATGTAPGAANVDFAVPHNLTHVPIGFMIVSTDRAAHIYKGVTTWTAATTTTQGNIYLRSDTASVVFTIIIL
jgi:hypothetical protein